MKTMIFNISKQFSFIQMLFYSICTLLVYSSTAQNIQNKTSIDRHALVTRHNIVWNEVKGQIPLGNGEFCFNVDGTGLQTFGGNSMSHWAWHSFPLPKGLTPQMIPATGTFQKGRNTGPDNSFEGNNAIRTWLYDNPHVFNLGRIRLKKAGGKEIAPDDIKNLERKLDLWSGSQFSTFTLDGQQVQVITCVNPTTDQVAIKIESSLLQTGQIEIGIDFPYPSIQRNNTWIGDFQEKTKQKTILTNKGKLRADFSRQLDSTSYFTALTWNKTGSFNQEISSNPHAWVLKSKSNILEFTCSFSNNKITSKIMEVEKVFAANEKHWPKFWQNGGAIDLSASKDSRWKELERRIVLSQYHTAIQSSGSNPPAEVGLMGTDPWRGQFHMEMIWWHLAHFALWNRWDRASKALKVYQKFIPTAKELATQLGYKGFKWQKSTGPEGRTAPWVGNQVLLWRQPHPIFFAELDYRINPTKSTLKKWAEIIEGTAEHMANYTIVDEQGIYHLNPVMPPSEQGITKDDVFDLAYWTWGLEQAQVWRERMGLPRNETWEKVRKNLTPLPEHEGLYLHSPEWLDTYTTRAWEHPNTIGIWGMLPPQKNIKYETAHNSLLKVMETWDWKRCWGWDFPWAAMAAARLGEPKLAIDALFIEAGTKNHYDERGICTGGPVPYLPGNGGLLYAVAMMAAGWEGSPNKHAPGFPDDGSWVVKWEGLKPAL